jgi:phage-related protein
MSNERPKFEVIFYWDERKRKPVEEFLSTLDVKTQAGFVWSIDELEKRGNQVGEPLSKPVEGHKGLFELREEVRTNIFRIIYVYYKGGKIILLHGFQKKGQKTPKGELEIAKQRQQRVPEFMREWEEEEAKKSKRNK